MTLRRDFFKIQNIMVYYGSGYVEELKVFDAVIIEPKGHTQEEILALREAGVIVLAYFSIMELPAYHEDFESLQTDFLWVNQQPIINKTFNTYYMNLNSPGWKAHLLNQADLLLQEQGYDGLFLDTVGDLENPLLEGRVKLEQIHAYIELLKMIRERNSRCLFVQNNGIEHVASYSRDYLDGVCWENPSFEKQHKAWSDMILNKLKTYQKKYYIRVLLLTDGSVDIKYMIKIAKRNKMGYSIAKRDYLGIQ
ncbi:MAG TPA: hypothetical protein DDZ89_11385 [Clostridiales bacterium]|nr:hypothetical protein [Clostridiales bacterium]